MPGRGKQHSARRSSPEACEGQQPVRYGSRNLTQNISRSTAGVRGPTDNEKMLHVEKIREKTFSSNSPLCEHARGEGPRSLLSAFGFSPWSPSFSAERIHGPRISQHGGKHFLVSSSHASNLVLRTAVGDIFGSRSFRLPKSSVARERRCAPWRPSLA